MKIMPDMTTVTSTPNRRLRGVRGNSMCFDAFAWETYTSPSTSNALRSLPGQSKSL